MDPLSDLRFLLALAPGQVGVVLERTPELAAAVEGEGLTVKQVAAAPWQVATGTADHVLLPLAGEEPEPLLAEAARVLKCGGSLLLGAGNSRSLYRERARPLLGPATAQAWVQKKGFDLVDVYGTRQALREPGWLIPLTSPGPARFYWEQRFVPYTSRSRLLARFAKWLARWGGQAWLFRNLVIIGRRVAEPGR